MEALKPKKIRKRKLSMPARVERLRAVINEVWEMSTALQRVELADEMLHCATSAQSIVHNDSEPIHVIDERDPVHRLVTLVRAYAEHAKLQPAELVDQITLRMGPIMASLAGQSFPTEEARWN